MLNHPQDVLAALGGLGLTVASATGDAAGVVLSATGVGAVAGAPAIAVSTAGVVAGGAMMTAAIGDLASHAGGDDRVEPIKTNKNDNSGVTGESAPASPAEAKPLQTDPAQVEAKFKHAQDFGVNTPRGKQGFNDFDSAVKDFANDPQNTVKGGTYRGEPAILRYNPDSGLIVVQKADGSFVSGWKMSPKQLEYVEKYGSLGGGG